VIEDEVATWREITDRKERLRARIEIAAMQPPFRAVTELWLTVPNVGLLLCARLHAATRGMAAELTPEQFRARVGSMPVLSESGNTAETKAAKAGFRPAKRDLYLACLTMIQRGIEPIASTFEYHKARGERFAMHKTRAKLVNVLSGIARSGKPYDPALIRGRGAEGEV
jgi:hypothetical protein